MKISPECLKHWEKVRLGLYIESMYSQVIKIQDIHERNKARMRLVAYMRNVPNYKKLNSLQLRYQLGKIDWPVEEKKIFSLMYYGRKQ